MGLSQLPYVDIQTLNSGVTGSLHLCVAKIPYDYSDVKTIRFIVDCGLFQERVPKKSEEDTDDLKKENINDILNANLPFNARDLDFALITHNHVDHIGRIPLLYRRGYDKKVYVSSPTKEIISYALNDSCKVLRDTAKRRHSPALYNDTDVNLAMLNIYGVTYVKSFYPVPNVKVTFFKNGHLAGAAIILVQTELPGTRETINLLFIGDYNNKNMFFTVPDLPQWVYDLPVTIVQESTYGDMNSTDIVECFEENLVRGLYANKSIVIPAFSLGRYQEILYFLKTMQQRHRLDPSIPIYADGKLAAIYTNMFLHNPALELDEGMMDFLPENDSFVSDSNQRSAIINDNNSKIILTTSGMGSYGPAQEYISKLISNPNAMIHFTGYTAEGTLGRRLKDAEIGEPVQVGSLLKIKRAAVMYTTEFSAHAKADEMISFLNRFSHINFIDVVHGEPEVKTKFASRILREVNNVKEVGIGNRDTFFRINPYGCAKSLNTHFQ